MVARFRRGFALRPVDSAKNIVNDLAIVGAATQHEVAIVDSVDSATLAVTNSVTIGSRVNQIYIECWLYGNAVAGINSRISWGIAKNPGTNLTMPSMSAAGVSDNKKFIFAMGTGLVGNSANGQPGYLIRGWFSVPRKYRRMGHDDRISLFVRNDTANDVNLCMVAVYKHYK